MVMKNVSNPDYSQFYFLKSARSGTTQEGETVFSSILNSTFTDINVTGVDLLHITYSEFDEIWNNTFTNIQGNLFYSKDSTFKNMTGMKLHDSQDCIYAIDSSFESISDSLFNNWGEASKNYGGAIRFIRSNSTITNSTFMKNKARSGASISLECTLESQCSTILKRNTFNENNATEMGGGIYYNLNRPVIEDWIFEGIFDIIFRVNILNIHLLIDVSNQFISNSKKPY